MAPRILAILLQEMDGFAAKKNVIVIGATNVPNMLDPALLRPGRLDKAIYMRMPNKGERTKIFKVHSRNLPLAKDVDFDRLAELSERFSGADIKNVCDEAARATAKRTVELRSKNVIKVGMAEFLQVIKSVRPSVTIGALDEQEKFKLDFERRTGKMDEKQAAEGSEKLVKWSDVVGLDDVRQVLLEAIEIPLLHEDLMKQYKIVPSKGLLLFGPPGCGKTLILKAAANELNATFLTLSGADLLKRGYEMAGVMIKETFNRAREQTPAIIFIDEIESVVPSRSSNSSPLIENIVTQVLSEMDGMKELKKVMFVGATNKPSMIDSALMRPGRFDKIIYIPPPDEAARQQILEINMKDIPMDNSVNFEKLAAATEGFTGADVTALCQTVKFRMVRRKIKKQGENAVITMNDFVEELRGRRPSVTSDMLREYVYFKREYGERK
ncbi:VCP-like ATPase [Candidatus Gugararchaeum adminiculabundum]|nr:VCP-like ATPase [Candidatus Gugararchaeum adminiculabundum]